MAIKWKSYKNHILLITPGIVLIIAIIFTVIVTIEAYSPGLLSNTHVFVLCISWIYVICTSITILFIRLEITYSPLDANTYQEKRKKLYKTLQICVIIYYILALLFLFFPQQYTYGYNKVSFFRELLLYQHHTWILSMMLLIMPALVELVILKLYYSFKYSFNVVLSRYKKLITIGLAILIALIFTALIIREYMKHSLPVAYFIVIFMVWGYAIYQGITYTYSYASSFKSIDFNIYQKKRLYFFKLIQFLTVIYCILLFFFLYIDFFDISYTNNNYYRLLLNSGRARTTFSFTFLLICIAELTNCIYFFSSKNKYDIELNQLSNLFTELQDCNRSVINPFTEKNILFPFGQALQNISRTTQTAVEKQIKSEKMKIDLITNISHDLKTPLTSIISYLDLLKKEELTPEATDYVTILGQRSEKLKTMIESLFDLAKTTSGNANLKIETMDLNRLVEQILADMDDNIKLSGKQLKINLSEDDLSFQSDSSYMYQVCQNLFENTLKYALNGTRIYIQTIAEQSHIKLKITNTANYEMNFTEENIVERFSRGDEARTTEGNGLGLAIAKTYTEACSGEFEVKIDGDQFKVELKFQKV